MGKGERGRFFWPLQNHLLPHRRGARCELSAQRVAVFKTGNGRHVEGFLELLREYELAG